MNEEQRAASAATLSEQIVSLIENHVGGAPGATEGDILSVGVTACVTTAVALAAIRAVDAKAAIALVTCVAETAAHDILPG